MKALQMVAVIICAAIFFAIFGAFFDVISSKEAIAVLVVFGLPLTLLDKFPT